MQLFSCPACGEPLYFDNLSCGCGAALAYDPHAGDFRLIADTPAHCSNRDLIGCNWAAAAQTGGQSGRLCRSCAMTEVTPDPDIADNLPLWQRAEAAKRHVLAMLARWGWFDAGDPGPLPVFHLLSEQVEAGAASVMMGHVDGLVTINVMEADPVRRVTVREQMAEHVRTMMGHYRHELAHVCFERLRTDQGFLHDFRQLFGDEREDYAAALAHYYEQGPPADWSQHFITKYASAHPHEDWAETVAHLLHLTDIVDSAVAVGLGALPADYDGYAEADAQRLLSAGMALGMALNHVNRSMGRDDLYPFVVPSPAREKLVFAHGWMRRR